MVHQRITLHRASDMSLSVALNELYLYVVTLQADDTVKLTWPVTAHTGMLASISQLTLAPPQSRGQLAS